jgi:hypothetical protein
MKEGLFTWSVALIFVAGIIPGVLMGNYLKVRYLLDPKSFQLLDSIYYNASEHEPYDTERNTIKKLIDVGFQISFLLSVNTHLSLIDIILLAFYFRFDSGAQNITEVQT